MKLKEGLEMKWKYDKQKKCWVGVAANNKYLIKKIKSKKYRLYEDGNCVAESSGIMSAKRLAEIFGA